jgi:hypothetical protein
MGSTCTVSNCSSGRVFDAGMSNINQQFGGEHCIPPQDMVSTARHGVHQGGLPLVTCLATIRNQRFCHASGDRPEGDSSSSSGLTAAYAGYVEQDCICFAVKAQHNCQFVAKLGDHRAFRYILGRAFPRVKINNRFHVRLRQHFQTYGSSYIECLGVPASDG